MMGERGTGDGGGRGTGDGVTVMALDWVLLVPILPAHGPPSHASTIETDLLVGLWWQRWWWWWWWLVGSAESGVPAVEKTK